MGHPAQLSLATVHASGIMQLERVEVMVADCFIDETITSVQSTQEIYDGCLTPVKTGNTFVTGFCSDPSQTENRRTFADTIARLIDRHME